MLDFANDALRRALGFDLSDFAPQHGFLGNVPRTQLGWGNTAGVIGGAEQHAPPHLGWGNGAEVIGAAPGAPHLGWGNAAGIIQGAQGDNSIQSGSPTPMPQRAPAGGPAPTGWSPMAAALGRAMSPSPTARHWM